MIIVDDEPLAREGLVHYASKSTSVDLIATASNIEELTSILSERDTDVIYLDICMPGKSGIEYLTSAHYSKPIVFTTAYSEFALQSYELNAIDYLLKPISFERFEKSIQKVYDYLTIQRNKNEGFASYIFLKKGNILHKVLIEDVLYIQAMSNYNKIYTANGVFINYGSLTSFYDQFDSSVFHRVHRSYIVNSQHIRGKRGKYLLIDHYEIPTNRNYKLRP